MAARAHPGDVAVDRIDLAVVAKEPERLCALPGRRGVRREALVEDAEGDGQVAVGQVGIERGELVGGAEGLVGDRSEGEGGDVRPADCLCAPARAVGARLRLVERVTERLEQHELLDAGHRRPSLLAERGRYDRHVTPAAEPDPLGGTGLLDGHPG
jgi:hypothetical protein